MGYNTRYAGEITITPPLAWSEFKDSPFMPESAWSGHRDLKLKVTEETVETAEGTLIRRQAVAVVPVSEDSYKGYDIVEHLQELVDTHPGHEFTGYLRADGEEPGDMWQLRVADGRAAKVTPRIVWPDGTEEQVR